VNTATTGPSRAVRLGWAAVATAAAGLSIWLVWWLAIPRADVCVAVYPAPPGCPTADRVGIATVWTVIVAVVYVAVLAALTLRVPAWVRTVLSALLVVVCVWAYVSTWHATPLGFRA
jgi:hypothetical protein